MLRHFDIIWMGINWGQCFICPKILRIFWEIIMEVIIDLLFSSLNNCISSESLSEYYVACTNFGIVFFFIRNVDFIQIQRNRFEALRTCSSQTKQFLRSYAFPKTIHFLFKKTTAHFMPEKVLITILLE